MLWGTIDSKGSMAFNGSMASTRLKGFKGSRGSKRFKGDGRVSST